MARRSETIEGPARSGHRSILCRRCATPISPRVDGTYRHDADGTAACVDPAQLYRDADARTQARPATVPCDCCGAEASRIRRRCTDCLIDGCEPGVPCRR